ncbi:MAG: radical SAM protein [Hyphomicrobiaceae bacterium]|nr:MAG: radical SAM protein [Hyphomicrobiaceae bacterium]
MATLVYTDALLTVNSVDLSDHVKSLELNYEAEMLDDTVMGTSGTRSSKAGLKNWSVDVEFLQDFAAGSVDATLFPLVGAASFPLLMRPVKATAVGATNPNYSGNAVLENYTPISGEVGTLGSTNSSFRAGGGAGNVLTRATV